MSEFGTIPMVPSLCNSDDDGYTDDLPVNRPVTVLDGTFFKIIGSNSSDNGVLALCQKCPDQHTVIRGNAQSSSNFISHLKRKHGEDMLQEYKDHVASKRRRTVSSQPRPRKKTKITQAQFEHKLTKFCIDARIPFGAIENKYFLSIMEDIDIESNGLRVPSAQTLERNLLDMFNMNKKHITEILSSTDYVCTTADIWSGENIAFMGVTAHWIGPNFQRKSAALACRRISNTHTHDRIATLLSAIHSEFNLSADKVVATVTDNVANFGKAFEAFGDNLLENDGTEPLDFLGTGYVKEEPVDISENPASEDPYGSEKTDLPNHQRCASQILNLCTTVDMIEGFKLCPLLEERHASVVSKCKDLWKLGSRPKTAEILHSVIGKTLSRPDETKWKSFHDALASVLESREKLDEIHTSVNFKSPRRLDADDFTYIEEYIQCSKPLASILDILEGEQNTFYGMLVPGLLSLRNKLKNLQKSQFSSCGELVDIYLSSLERRFHEFFEMTTSTAISGAIAALSHPSFKKKWLHLTSHDQQSQILMEFKKVVIREIQLANCEKESPSSPQTNDMDSSMSYFDFETEDNDSMLSNEWDGRAEVEIAKYFRRNDSSLKSLHAFPFIREVFLKYNTPLPSSAPVEKLFSSASITNQPITDKMTDSMFEMRIISKANSFVLQE